MLGSAGGLVVASIILLTHQDVRARVVPWLVSYAVGTLLGAAMLGLVPQALASLPPDRAFLALLVGILSIPIGLRAFIAAERYAKRTGRLKRSG